MAPQGLESLPIELLEEVCLYLSSNCVLQLRLAAKGFATSLSRIHLWTILSTSTVHTTIGSLSHLLEFAKLHPETTSSLRNLIIDLRCPILETNSVINFLQERRDSERIDDLDALYDELVRARGRNNKPTTFAVYPLFVRIFEEFPHIENVSFSLPDGRLGTNFLRRDAPKQLIDKFPDFWKFVRKELRLCDPFKCGPEVACVLSAVAEAGATLHSITTRDPKLRRNPRKHQTDLLQVAPKNAGLLGTALRSMKHVDLDVAIPKNPMEHEVAWRPADKGIEWWKAMKHLESLSIGHGEYTRPSIRDGNGDDAFVFYPVLKGARLEKLTKLEIRHCKLDHRSLGTFLLGNKDSLRDLNFEECGFSDPQATSSGGRKSKRLRKGRGYTSSDWLDFLHSIEENMMLHKFRLDIPKRDSVEPCYTVEIFGGWTEETSIFTLKEGLGQDASQNISFRRGRFWESLEMYLDSMPNR